MEIMIFVLIVFLAIVYVYSFMKIRKRKKANNSTVLEFKEKYLSKKELKDTSKTEKTNYTKYITKYNSSVDYISKEDYFDQ